MPGATGRNDPCPCGSGRKFKHCCLETAGAAEASRLRIRQAEGRIVDQLLPYAVDAFGRAFFEHAWSDFFLSEPQEDDITQVPEFETMFVPWFVTLFVRDPYDEISESHWPDVPVAEHWLASERPALTDLERAWIHAACRSPMSVFAVVGTEPGRSVDLRDVLTGREFHALEQSASRTLRPGDLHVTRVVTVGGASVMFGGAPFSIPADWHVRILDWRDRLFRRRRVTRKMLEEYDIEIRNLYLDLVDELHHPTPPVLRNTDGDDLQPTTLAFELSCPVAEAFDRLKPLATLSEETQIHDVSTDESGGVVRASLDWVKAGNRQHKTWTNTILGTLRLEPGRLTAEVNSAKRADRLTKEVKRRLGADATLVSREAESLDGLFERVRENRADRASRAEVTAGAGEEATDDEPRRPELDAMEDDLYRQHLEAWIDTRVPALGNRTPRQASRTARGRERIDALLSGFATRDKLDRPARRQAMAALRRELGLPALDA